MQSSRAWGRRASCSAAWRLGARRRLVLAANRDVGVLYGAFHLLRLLATERPLATLDVVSSPKIRHRLLNHWALWDGLCLKYQAGVNAVRGVQLSWRALEGAVDRPRFEHVLALLKIQEKEARWWRDACVLYFQTFAKPPIPAGCEAPESPLDELIRIRHRYVRGAPNCA